VNDLLFSAWLKFPNKHYPLSYETEAFEFTFVELQQLLNANINLNFENLRVWALYLQRIDLSQFSQAELLAIIAINIVDIFSYESNDQTYFLPTNNNLLYSQGSEVYYDVDFSQIEIIYKSQIKSTFYFSKTFLQELFITHS